MSTDDQTASNSKNVLPEEAAIWYQRSANENPAQWHQRYGNLSQIASAVLSLLTLSVAAYGVTAAAPYFKNKQLTENNARLEIEKLEISAALDSGRKELADMSYRIIDARRSAWYMTCSLASNRIPRGLDLFDDVNMATSSNWPRMFLLGDEKTTYRIALNDAIASVDVSGLTQQDKLAYKYFSERFVRSLPNSFDERATLQIGNSRSDEPTAIRTQVTTFRAACEAEAPR